MASTPTRAARWLTALMLVAPTAALAHTRGGEALGFASGLRHPISGLDHVGNAHGTELPPGANAILYSIGFVIATGLLHATGIGLGVSHRWPAGRAALRTLGAGVALAGVVFLWQAVARGGA